MAKVPYLRKSNVVKNQRQLSQFCISVNQFQSILPSKMVPKEEKDLTSFNIYKFDPSFYFLKEMWKREHICLEFFKM